MVLGGSAERLPSRHCDRLENAVENGASFSGPEGDKTGLLNYYLRRPSVGRFANICDTVVGISDGNSRQPLQAMSGAEALKLSLATHWRQLHRIGALGLGQFAQYMHLKAWLAARESRTARTSAGANVLAFGPEIPGHRSSRILHFP
jgi:hypothetical protein